MAKIKAQCHSDIHILKIQQTVNVRHKNKRIYFSYNHLLIRLALGK
jgi:hypothetical protein